MSLTSYARLAATFFAIIAALQLIRAISGWPITLNAMNVPVWPSWIAFLVTAALAWLGFSAARG